MVNIEEKIFTAAYKNIIRDPEYVKQTSKVINLGRKIMEYLGCNKVLLLEYEKAIGLAEGIYLESAYRLGLDDGLNISNSCPTKCPTEDKNI